MKCTFFQDKLGNYWKDNQPSQGFDHLQKNCNGSTTVEDILECINSKTYSLGEAIRGIFCTCWPERLILFEKNFRHFAQPVKFSDTVHNLYQKNSLMEFWQSNTLTPYNGIQSLLLNNFNVKCINQPTGQCHTLLPSVRVQADMLHDGILVHFDPEMSYRVIIHDPRCKLWVLWWFSWCHLQPSRLCFITNMAISTLPLWMENILPCHQLWPWSPNE